MRRQNVVAAVTIAVLAIAAGCSTSKDLKTGPMPVDPLFASYVALGNSVTAGYQSGGINDSTQKQSYARVFAEQAVTRYAYASLAMPGCPPPIVNLLTGERVGGGTPTTCALRTPIAVGTPGGLAPLLNNVAVPGANSLDPTSPLGSFANPLTTFILGGKTQAQKALEAKPTFVSAFIGNNDVLPAALSGILVPLGDISPGLTPVDTFEARYSAMLTELTSGGTVKGGALLAVVDVTNLPILFPSALLLASAQVKAAFDAVAGMTTTVDATCGDQAALINFQLAAAIRDGTHPPTIYCGPVPPDNPVLGVYVLSPARRDTVSQRVAAYNEFIKAQAASLGWAYVDINPTLLALKQAGQIPLFPNLANPTQPFGTYVSNDGVHPSGTGHRAIANLIIDSVNVTYGKSIPEVSP